MTIGNIIITSKRKGGTKAPSGYKVFNVAKGSPLYNKFSEALNPRKEDPSLRQEVCNLYQWHFEDELLQNPAVQKYLQEIAEYVMNGGNAALECWCSPLQCHAETIKTYIEEVIDE